MAIYTQEDMDRKLMRKIIGDFPPGNYVTPELAMQRHCHRMIMLVRWTFLRYCERITNRIMNSRKQTWHYYGQLISKERAVGLLQSMNFYQ